MACGAHRLARGGELVDATTGATFTVPPHSFVKADGTACFYFDLDDVSELFAGFDVLSLKLDCRQEANRATKTRRRRVFVEGDFRKRRG